MDLHTIFTFAMAVFALAIKPGPGMMTVISRTLVQGMPACFAFLSAVCIVSLLYLGLVLTGLRFAEEDLVFISILLKAAAAAWLIYLGVKGLQNPDIDMALEYKEQRVFDIFTASLILTLSNPLVIVFYGGLVPSLIDINNISFDDVLILSFVIVVVEVSVAVAYCLPFAYSRNFITPTLLRKVNIGSSIVLILVGLFIGYSAMPANDILSVVEQ
jgi:threonine/homoserine/homoserine lactone efflux protein